jgi:hypothetical protein
VPTYAAFDALAGIGTGILVQNAQHLTPLQGNHFESLIDAYWNANVINALAAIGSIAWVIAMIASAVASTDADRRRLAGLAAVILFFVGGWAQTNLFLINMVANCCRHRSQHAPAPEFLNSVPEARDLNTGQPAVSKKIAGLEDRLSVLL